MYMCVYIHISTYTYMYTYIYRLGNPDACIEVFRKYIDEFAEAGAKSEVVHVTLSLASFLAEVHTHVKNKIK